MIFKRQITAEDTADLFVPISADDGADLKRKQRKLLVATLSGVAEQEQVRVRRYLERLENRLRRDFEIRPLWIVNVLGAKTPKSVVEDLTSFGEVESIHLDLPRAVRAEIPVSPGVQTVGANQVWDAQPTGYNGSGVVVAVVDSGVDYAHDYLKNRMWINTAEDADHDNQLSPADNDQLNPDGNCFPNDVIGWDFYGSPEDSELTSAGARRPVNDALPDGCPEPVGDNDPLDTFGHGTQVAAVVAGDGGKRGSGDVITGVAPGARIMVLRDGDEFASEGAGLAAAQYALESGADIVNYSSGFSDSDERGAPSYGDWRLKVEHLMDGGVLFVTVPDNDGNSLGVPCNVRTPGRAPLALTVGATDAADDIADFSNHGPVTWPKMRVLSFRGWVDLPIPAIPRFPRLGLPPIPPPSSVRAWPPPGRPWGVASWSAYPHPPGLRKPDVYAPGVSVYSAVMGTENGWNEVSGTSFSAPSAAGVAALLLQKNPDLSAYELKYLLEETAVDLGVAGPDDAFGWGRIDALAALEGSISSSPYELSVKGTNELSIAADLWVDNDHDGSPDTPILGSDNYLYAVVSNLGGRVVAKVELEFYYTEINATATGNQPVCDAHANGGVFDKIDSYVVPILGPSESRHKAATGFVRWQVPSSPGKQFCVAVQAEPLMPPLMPPGWPGEDTSNNQAFRGFTNFVSGAGKVKDPSDCRQFNVYAE